MSETLASVEKSSLKWETYTGSKKDVDDLDKLMAVAKTTGELPQKKIHAPAENDGLLLRRGDIPLGYVAWDIREKTGGKIMFITLLFISPEARSMGSSVTFVRALRREAERLNVTNFMWNAKSEEMRSLSKKIGAERAGLVFKSIPVGQLTPQALLHIST